MVLLPLPVLGTSTSPKYSSTSTSTLILKELEYSKKYKLKKYSGTHYKFLLL